ncbi:teichoic acid D-Ala incorporation-associated protein DltX [Leuconostocaceae bacterium ESL0723]|nr:teichoic acid D-Ala incorporation-associated protein DltX [Lactobacillaceae bacterium L1_55_11]WEV54294.1 teichoic acid D-Ala incorporation-associated protein DltX [Leuconostocaceae bacterium ESL0723]
MFKKFFQQPLINFILRTLFYFLVILTLIYLYSFSGVTGGHFIYNEF